jgi:hypothetical protein
VTNFDGVALLEESVPFELLKIEVKFKDIKRMSEIDKSIPLVALGPEIHREVEVVKLASMVGVDLI